MTTQTFTISGFDCDSCIKLSQSILADLSGVKQVKISGLDGKTEIQTEREISLDEIQQAFEGTQYQVSR